MTPDWFSATTDERVALLELVEPVVEARTVAGQLASALQDHDGKTTARTHRKRAGS